MKFLNSYDESTTINYDESITNNYDEPITKSTMNQLRSITITYDESILKRTISPKLLSYETLAISLTRVISLIANSYSFTIWQIQYRFSNVQ